MANLMVVGSPSMIQLQANEWVTQVVLASVTGFSPGKIRSYRQRGWRQGKEWLLIACDGQPKATSEALYNIPAINLWFASQAANQPAV